MGCNCDKGNVASSTANLLTGKTTTPQVQGGVPVAPQSPLAPKQAPLQGLSVPLTSGQAFVR